MLRTNLNDAKRQAIAMNIAGVDKMVVNHFSSMVSAVEHYSSVKTELSANAARRAVESVHNELSYRMNAGKTADIRTAMTMACIITAAIKKDLANEIKPVSSATDFVAKRTANARLVANISMAYRDLTRHGYNRANLSTNVKFAMVHVEDAIKSACALKTDAAITRMKNEVTSALRCISKENCSYTMEMYETKAFLQKAVNM